MRICLRRRQLLAALGSAAAWPVGARAAAGDFRWSGSSTAAWPDTARISVVNADNSIERQRRGRRARRSFGVG